MEPQKARSISEKAQIAIPDAGTQNHFTYGDPSMADLAPTYASGIIKNHPFLDGNKRKGFMMGAGFLERNGYEFFADEAYAAIRTLSLAAGEMTEKAYSAWLETNSTKPE
jgi:death-on-curing protein